MPLREFSSVKVGDQLPEKVITLTRQDLVNYAGVSGDLNPIHWDDDIAKQVGLDTAIAHGMLTMGLGGGYVTSWVGDLARSPSTTSGSPPWCRCRTTALAPTSCSADASRRPIRRRSP